jgi:hypothetical protein
MQQKFRFNRLTFAATIFAWMLAAACPVDGSVIHGQLYLATNELTPGSSISLAGTWLYKPGYNVQAGQHPEAPSATAGMGFLPVVVPQFLNRVSWWLDDSEDFKKFETERLKKMGFDTDRAEDGWYRLEMTLPALPPRRRLFLAFDGVAMKCKVFCNGQPLGEHEGMFSRFEFDLTPNLHPGLNVITVYDSMEKNYASSASMGQAVTVNLTASKVKTMSKGMYGPWAVGANNRSYDLHGIWQPVRLIARDDAQINDVWFVPSLRGGNLIVTGRDDCPAAIAMTAEWTDAKTGELLARLNSELAPRAGSFSHGFILTNVQPKLWTPADPNLYRLQVKLSCDGNVVDQWSSKVGFRTFEIRGNRFFLNGHPWWLRGADHLPYGKNPWDPVLPRDLVQLMHDGHINITRTHCTPWNEAWLDAADEIGLGVSLEGIRPWALSGQIGGTPPEMMTEWLRENKDVVERCRNHPSVLIYTVGNEMLLRDSKNIEKWKQLSDVVKQTREVDPTRPVICSSEYQRDPQFYEESLKPNGIDDGDIDDLHRYNNWYGPSSFVFDSKFVNEMKRNRGLRPLMGQEMSTGYPNLDSGLPVTYYTRDLLAPQAWVGIDSYPGSDPAVFLEHHRAVTKRWAEQLRFQRGTNTAGFMLFATECWFKHSYDPQTLAPYPVYAAMREADAPIGLAWETGRRRFFAGEKLETAVFISNDDDRFRDLHDLQLTLAWPDGRVEQLAHVDNLPYDKTIRVPVTVTFRPAGGAREKVWPALRLEEKGRLVSQNTDAMEVFARSTTVAPDPSVLIIKPGESLDGLAPGQSIRQQIEHGATAIVFSPGREIVRLFPEAIVDSKKVVAEFADTFPIANTPLARGLQPMDLKWWGRTNDWRTFVASTAQRLREKGPAHELIRYIPPHGYTALDKLPEQYWTVMWELPLGLGRLWVCDLDLQECSKVDPAAALFEANLYRAAADPGSTRSLPRIPSHANLMRGRQNIY